jgi:hypothetical protein
MMDKIKKIISAEPRHGEKYIDPSENCLNVGGID